VDLEQGIEQLYDDGGMLRRRSWDSGSWILIEDVVADDWEVVEYPEEDE